MTTRYYSERSGRVYEVVGKDMLDVIVEVISVQPGDLVKPGRIMLWLGKFPGYLSEIPG